MSCTCKPSYYNIPCCCANTITTTTTTVAGDDVCAQVYGSSSIFYPYVSPDCLGLPQNANLTDILVAIIQTFPGCEIIPCDITTDCPSGYICMNGICVPNVCDTDVDCPSGYVCINGTCEIPCDNGECPSGYICINGICHPNVCDNNLDCPTGYSCVNGTCEPTSCEVNGDCPIGYLCVNGICQPNTCDTTVDCPSGYVCVNGTCLPVCEDNTDCPSGYTCVDGVCEIPCEDENCPIGFTCVNGICQPSTCSIDIDCPIGFICINGTCQPNSCDTNGDCPNGYLCIDGECQPNVCDTTIDCPSGYECLNGTCVPIPPPTTTTTAAPNSPCNPYILQVTADCTYQTYNNLNSSNNFTVPDPGCGNYLGGDVWFSIIVPSSGQIVISLQAGTITDAAMAIYLGTCSSLVQILCVDDSGGNPMPEATITGLTPGVSVFVRVWSYGNQQTGTFGICTINPALNPCTIAGTAANVLCLTTTTTTAAINLPECPVLYVANYSYSVGSSLFKGSNVYYYNVNTNTSTLLTVPGVGANSPIYADIAHTANKLWLTNPTTSSFIEYDISLSPWIALYSQTIPYPTNFVSSTGLHAIDNNRLLTVNNYNLLANPATNPAVVTELNISGNSITPKFNLIVGRSVYGDFMLTTNGKFIVTTQAYNTTDIYISQYDYATGALEFDLLISGSTPGPAITTPYGLFESGSNIYIMDSNNGVYLINKTSPYSRTLVGFPIGGHTGDKLYGGSQLPGCVTQKFTANIPTTTTTSTTTSTTSTTTTTTQPPFVNETHLMGTYEVFSVCGINPIAIVDGNPDPGYDKLPIGISSEPCGTCSCLSFIHITNDENIYASWDANVNCNGECFVNCADEWTTINLNTDRYANGDLIPQVSDPAVWSTLTTGAWCYYNNSTANGTTYGRLYNRYALTDPRGLQLPAGYRLPTTVDWVGLKDCVGGHSYYLKNDTAWSSPFYGSSRTVFNALPGGYRKSSGTFADLGQYARFWALDGFTRISLGPNEASIQTNGGIDPKTGLSIRLIQI